MRNDLMTPFHYYDHFDNGCPSASTNSVPGMAARSVTRVEEQRGLAKKRNREEVISQNIFEFNCSPITYIVPP